MPLSSLSIPALIFFPNFVRLIIKGTYSEFFINLLSKKSLGDFVEIDNIYVPSRYPFKAILYNIIFLLLKFISLYLCFNAMGISIQITLINLIAIFSLSWVLGLIMPAAPGGIGVFEGFLLMQLKQHQKTLGELELKKLLKFIKNFILNGKNWYFK